MAELTVAVTFDGTGSADVETLRPLGDGNRLSLIANLLRSIGANNLTRRGNPTIIVGGTKATGTVTFSVAAAANNDTVTIGGRVYTFKTTPAAVDDLALGATFGASAQNLANAINQSTGGGYFAGTKRNAMVTATVVGGVVTLTSRFPGTIGNLITTAKSGTNIAVGGAALTGGVNGDSL
jgi:phage tail sheath gpL-like